MALDKFLATGEQPLRTEHQHWFVLIANAMLRDRDVADRGGPARPERRRSSTATAGSRRCSAGSSWSSSSVGLAWFGWQVLVWQNEQFVLTNRRVLRLTGVLNKTVMDSSLEKINDAVLTESVFGRIFGFGDLEIQTASESGIDRLRMLRDAPRLQAGDARLEARARARAVGGQADAGPAYRRPRAGGRCPSIGDAPAGSLAAAAPVAASAPPAARCRPTRSPGRWRAWPTCAIGARSAPRSTRRRRRTCWAASDRRRGRGDRAAGSDRPVGWGGRSPPEGPPCVSISTSSCRA